MRWAPSRLARKPGSGGLSENPSGGDPAPGDWAPGDWAPGDPARGAGVEVEHLTWRPYGRAAPVFDGLNLAIEPGERVLLAGPSGSGKSTLLRALAGLLLTADAGDLAGSVRIGGKEPQAHPGLAGLVLQDPGSGVVAASLRRDVAFGLENLGMPRAQISPLVTKALASVRLTMDPDSSTSSLSGGELQRLALAGALAMSPRLLLLDEPTAMLDPGSAATVRSVVADVVGSRGLTTVIVEHRIGCWLGLVDRVLVLDSAGRLMADGPPGTVMRDQADALLAQGIWVPGRPDPTPLGIPVGFGPAALRKGEVTVSVRGLAIRHTSRPLNRRARVTTAVRDVDLTVLAGESLALVGPSGSGKSSLLAAVGGLLEPSAGAVVISSRLGHGPPHGWSSSELARRVAWVPQSADRTILARTVREEVLTTPRALGMDEAMSGARADVLLDRLGLTHLADADPRRLSGGEQRRLAIASAAVHQPALMLADEPTVGQDRLTWAAVMGVLAAVRCAGSAVLVTTHDDGVRAHADAVLALPTQHLGPGVEPEADAVARRRPLASRAGPLSLLMASLLVLPLPALLDTWRPSLVVLAAEGLLGLVALSAPGRGAPPPAGRLRAVLTRLGPAALGALGVAWSAWLLGGRDLQVALGAGLRLLALVVPSVILLPYVNPDALGDHLAQRLHLPPRPVVAATAALARFQAFGQLWAELLLARRVRGVGAGRAPAARARELAAVTFAMFVGTLGQAATLALAMDARGFAGARRRSWTGSAPWRVADSLVVLASLLVVLAGAVARALLQR